MARSQTANIAGSRTAFEFKTDTCGFENTTVPSLTRTGPQLMAGLHNAPFAQLRDTGIITVQTDPDPFGDATMIAKRRLLGWHDPSSSQIDSLIGTQFQPGGLMTVSLFEALFPNLHEGDRVAFSSFTANSWAHMLPSLMLVRTLSAEGGTIESVERALAAVPIPTLLTEALQCCLDIVLDGIIIRCRPFGGVIGYNEAVANYIVRDMLTSEVFSRLSASSSGGGTTPLAAAVMGEVPTLTGDDARAAIDLCFDYDEDTGEISAGVNLEYTGHDQSVVITGPAAAITDDALRKLAMAGLIRLVSPEKRVSSALKCKVISDPTKVADGSLFAAYTAAAAGVPLLAKTQVPELKRGDDRTANVEVDEVHEWWSTWDDAVFTSTHTSNRLASSYSCTSGFSPSVGQAIVDIGGSGLRLGTFANAAAKTRAVPISVLTLPLTPKG